MNQLTCTRDSGQTAQLCAHLNHAARGLGRFRGIAGPHQFVHFRGQRLFDADVFSCLRCRFEVRRVVEIRRGNHHRINPVHREEVSVGRKHLRLPTEPFLHHAVGLLTVDAPRIGQGDDFKIGCGEMFVDSLHMGRASPIPAADHADTYSVVGSDGTCPFCGCEVLRAKSNTSSESCGGFRKERRLTAEVDVSFIMRRVGYR